VDLSLTDKDGKQDAKEDDDEKDEPHGFLSLIGVHLAGLMRAGLGGYGI
jgi:hypothetical protein